MKELRPGVWFVEAENRGRYPYAHSLYLKGEERLLIDTGAGPVLKELASKTEKVVLSHYHRDHVTYNHLFTGACFYIHEDDAVGVESMEGFLRISGLDQVDIESYWKMVRQSNFSATRIDRRLKDGDHFDLGGLQMQVLHLPGHTPGHCGFLIDNYNIVFAADIDLTRFGPWYGNVSSDVIQFRQSIRRLRELKPDMIITGHSTPVKENISQKLAQYETALDQRDEEILAALKEKPSTVEELSAKNIIYRRHYGQEILKHFENKMIAKHLESLLKRELVVKMENGLYEAL